VVVGEINAHGRNKYIFPPLVTTWRTKNSHSTGKKSLTLRVYMKTQSQEGE